MTRADLELIPQQGHWTERQYLELNTNALVEFDNGMIEVLAVPTKIHQLIVAFLYKALEAFIATNGRVLFAPYPLRVPPRKYREPDILYLTPQQDAQTFDEFTNSAELVMEVVSPSDPDRDYVKKRHDYAKAGISEYWIIDRYEQMIIVLRLENGEYIEHGKFGPGQRADSARLPGFSVAVDDVLSQGQ